MSDDPIRSAYDEWTRGRDPVSARIALFERVRDLPFRYPSTRDAREVLQQGAGSCSGKHNLLCELFHLAGLSVRHDRVLIGEPGDQIADRLLAQVRHVARGDEGVAGLHPAQRRVQAAERPEPAQLVGGDVDGEPGVLLRGVADHDHVAEAAAQHAQGAGEDGFAADAEERLVDAAHAAVATSRQDDAGHAGVEPRKMLTHELTQSRGATAQALAKWPENRSGHTTSQPSGGWGAGGAAA